MHFDTKTLEFDKIITQVQAFAQTTIGKQKVGEITPTNNPLVIHRELNEASHALAIVFGYKEAPFGGIRDLKEALQKARIFSILTPYDLLDIVSFLDAIGNAVRFYKQVKENEIEGEALDEYFYRLELVPYLKNEIMTVITIDGFIHDSASSELHRIRSTIQRLKNKINEKLNHILQKDKSSLTESLITLRHGRFTVPVKISEKNKFKGTIVDYSSSGETVYIEPQAIAEINNQLSTLAIEEHQEIDKLLRKLTVLVGDHHAQLLSNYETLGYLDMVFAKGRYAAVNECIRPIITENEIDLIKARHPLIDMEIVVANTITFQQDEQIIVITGPNTGGKTVTLKTMGLLSIMAQSGLLIPAHEDSKTIIFDNIFADIGDEQSIEQSLSTFSSHMTNIIKIIDHLSVGSLVLLDELGSGTDPKEGASLAISILEYLRPRGVYVIATTHYSELKGYAYKHHEIVNASVEFDINTLRPTYRLLLGTPGKSNAILVSERLGLQEKIVKYAKEHTETSNSEVSDLILKLETKGNQLEEKMRNYDEMIEKQKAQLKENEDLRKELIYQRNKINEKIEIEASEYIARIKQEANVIIKQLEELQKQDYLKPHEIADMKHQISTLKHEKELESHTKEHVYVIGDFVNVLKFNRPGVLVERKKNGNWIVQMGSLTSQFKENEIEFIEHKEKAEKKQSKITNRIKKTVKAELDLRGMRYEEAKLELDQYIDDCILVSMPFANIIHGYGTLTLRKLVKEYLDQHPHIKSHRDGDGNEGGSGVTVVYFH